MKRVVYGYRLLNRIDRSAMIGFAYSTSVLPSGWYAVNALGD